VALGTFVLAASLLVSQLAAPAPAVFPLALVQPALVAAQQDPNPQPTVSDFHRFDIGGSMAASTRGAGGSFRVWLTKNVAVNFAAAYYRQSVTTAGVQAQSAFQLTPSVIVMLAPAHAGADLYVRPYVGGGMNYTHVGGVQATSNVSSLANAGRVGMEAFGGAEIGGQQLGKMTISAEMAYYHLPVSFSNSPALNGVNFILGLHIYF
jgi:outer membrane protein W